jgi:hypothetical protein
VLNFAICDLQKRGGRATVLSARAASGERHVPHGQVVVVRRKCPEEESFLPRPSQAPSGHFLRPSRSALMAKSDAERMRQYRQRKSGSVAARDDGAGELAFLRQENADLRSSNLELHRLLLEAQKAVTDRNGFRNERNVTERYDGSFLPASDASHNRAHALSISESLLVSDTEEKKERTPSSPLGDPDQYGAYTDGWRERCYALGVGHVSVTTVTPVTPLRNAPTVTESTPKPETSGEIELILGRGETKRIKLWKTPTPEQMAESRRLQTEVAKRWAAEQERRGAAG